MMAIVLAAGRSSRTRGHKACRRVKGQSWLVRQCHDLRKRGYGPIRVVLGYSARRVARCVPPGIHRLWHPKASRGPFSSLQRGVANTKANVLILPLDVPLPKVGTLQRLRKALRHEQAVIPVWRGRGGHPVLLSAALAQGFARMPLTPTTRLDLVLRNSPCCRVPTQDRSILTNLNRSRDWSIYRQNHNLRKSLWMG